MKKLMFGLVAATLLSGCATMTIHPNQQVKLSNEPTYEETIPFYFWGLVGEKRIDVKAVCAGKEAVQMQTQATPKDLILGAVTLGIYAPHTAKVWCK